MPRTPTDHAGEASTTAPERPPALEAMLLGGGILCVLALALMLEASPEPAAVPRPAPAPSPVAYTVEILDPEPVPTAPIGESSLASLAARASSDAGRLGASPDGWVVQIAAVCDPENAGRAVEIAGTDRRLHLLPTLIGDDPCFRICWGPYASAEDAARATDLTAAIRALGQPQARRVAEVLP